MKLGTLPGTFISETMLDQVATTLGMTVEEVKRKNLYQQDQVCCFFVVVVMKLQCNMHFVE